MLLDAAKRDELSRFDAAERPTELVVLAHIDDSVAVERIEGLEDG